MIPDEPYFSWASRRIVIDARSTVAGPWPPLGGEVPATAEQINLGGRMVRLLALADHEDDYAAVFVGKITNGCDVRVRVVDEERLLIDASRCTCGCEIIVGVPTRATLAGQDRKWARELVHQLCAGGAFRDVLAETGVRSVIIDKFDAAAAVA